MKNPLFNAIAGIVIFGIIVGFITGSDFTGITAIPAWLSDLLPDGYEVNSNSSINYKEGLKESTSFMKSIGAMK